MAYNDTDSRPAMIASGKLADAKKQSIVLNPPDASLPPRPYHDNGDAVLKALAADPNLLNITELDVSHCGITDEGALALAQSPYSANLTSLHVNDNPITQEGLTALVQSAHMRNVRAVKFGTGGVLSEFDQVLVPWAQSAKGMPLLEDINEVHFVVPRTTFGGYKLVLLPSGERYDHPDYGLSELSHFDPTALHDAIVKKYNANHPGTPFNGEPYTQAQLDSLNTMPPTPGKDQRPLK